MAKGRISQLECERRTAQVVTLVLSGLRPSEIYRITMSEWGASRRTIARYLNRAQADLQPLLEEQKGARVAEHIAHRRDLRRRARTAGDLRIELEVAKDEARLLQLYPAERQHHEHSGPDGGPITLTAVRDLLTFPEDR